MFFLNYKQKAETNKKRIVKNGIKSFKRCCLREFRKSIKRGLYTANVTCSTSGVNSDFEKEILEQALKELSSEHKNIEFSISYTGCMNSYRGIKMVAK